MLTVRSPQCSVGFSLVSREVTKTGAALCGVSHQATLCRAKKANGCNSQPSSTEYLRCIADGTHSTQPHARRKGRHSYTRTSLVLSLPPFSLRSNRRVLRSSFWFLHFNLIRFFSVEISLQGEEGQRRLFFDFTISSWASHEKRGGERPARGRHMTSPFKQTPQGAQACIG